MSLHQPGRPVAEKTFDAFAENIKHAEHGCRNAQNIIQFVDTKAGVIAGFTFVGLGVVLQGIKEFLCLSKDIQDCLVAAFKLHPACATILFGFCVISIGLGILSLWFVVQCVAARAPRIGLDLKHSTLFPIYHEVHELGRARDHFEKLKRGLTQAEIIQEYEVQLLNLGAILHKKMRCQHWAATAFLGQLLLISLSGAILFVYTYLYIIAGSVLQ